MHVVQFGGGYEHLPLQQMQESGYSVINKGMDNFILRPDRPDMQISEN